MQNEYLENDMLTDLWNNPTIDNYYVYFNKDAGDIVSISNELTVTDYSTVQITFEEVERFLVGKDNFIFYRLTFDDEGAVKFVNKKETVLAFKSNIIEYIRVVENNTAILQVVWTPTNWIFKVHNSFLQNPRSKSLNSKINFFVTKETDINILLHSIEIQIKQLVNGDVIIPFDSIEELDANSVAMFTLPFFETYGMTIDYGTD